MKKDDKIINLTDRKIDSTFKGLSEIKGLQDAEHLVGEDLDKERKIQWK